MAESDRDELPPVSKPQMVSDASPTELASTTRGGWSRGSISASWAWRLVPSPHRGHRLAAQRRWLLREKISEADNRAITAIRVVENNTIVLRKNAHRQLFSLSSPSEHDSQGDFSLGGVKAPTIPHYL